MVCRNQQVSILFFLFSFTFSKSSLNMSRMVSVTLFLSNTSHTLLIGCCRTGLSEVSKWFSVFCEEIISWFNSPCVLYFSVSCTWWEVIHYFICIKSILSQRPVQEWEKDFRKFCQTHFPLQPQGNLQLERPLYTKPLTHQLHHNSSFHDMDFLLILHIVIYCFLVLCGWLVGLVGG